MDLNEITDKELCDKTYHQDTVTDFEKELMTRLIERNCGAKEREAIANEPKVDDPAMIPIDRAILICFSFLIAQAFIFLYIIP